MITLIDSEGNPFDYCYTKDEVMAILTELQDKIFKESWRLECLCDNLDGSAIDLEDINKIIQQKIDKLREGEL